MLVLSNCGHCGNIVKQTIITEYVLEHFQNIIFVKLPDNPFKPCQKHYKML